MERIFVLLRLGQRGSSLIRDREVDLPTSNAYGAAEGLPPWHLDQHWVWFTLILLYRRVIVFKYVLMFLASLSDSMLEMGTRIADKILRSQSRRA